MKKFSLFALLAGLLFVACNDDNDTVYDPYASVRPGITIYNSTSTQQSVATDPASAAVKLAMLIDEAAKQQTTIDEVTVTYNSASYKLSNLLFGPSTRITEEEPGRYRIAYFDNSAGVRDTFYRQGVYIVNTQGISLAESSEDTPWTVGLDKDPVYLTSGNGYLETTYLIESGTNTLYRLPNGSYALLVEEVAAHLRGYPEYLSNWSGDFTWSASTSADDLAYTTHREDVYTLYGSASGESFFLLGSAVQTELRYTVPTTNPVQWQPSRTLSIGLIISGEERAAILNTASVSTADFPAPSVSVVRELDGNTILTTVIYNNNTVQL